MAGLAPGTVESPESGKKIVAAFKMTLYAASQRDPALDISREKFEGNL